MFAAEFGTELSSEMRQESMQVIFQIIFTVESVVTLIPVVIVVKQKKIPRSRRTRVLPRGNRRANKVARWT